MDDERWDRIQILFHGAAVLPSSEQAAYLRAACAGDEILLAKLLAMLEEDARGESLLDHELPKLAHDLLDGSLPLIEFGPYRITKMLGEGGMGTVYLAERKDIGGLVAIKILRDGTLSPARRKRFASEQAALAHLSHPLIARIYDAGALADGTPWFVMEYVEGLPLTEYCQQRGLSIDQRLKLFRSVCEAVQYAHGQAIIHRDLKPSNILVKPDGTVKLLDFGIAKQLATGDAPADQTQTWLRLMTPVYAAPEQMRGELPSTQADVYSLGVILYELLAGQRPFDLSGKTAEEAERTIMQQEPEPPSATAKYGPAETGGLHSDNTGATAWRDLDVLTMTAMHRDHLRRYRSVEALMRDCDHYLKGEPLEARPDTMSYRLGKFIRRNRRALSVTAATLLILVTVVAYFAVRLAKARSAELAEAHRTQRIERFMLNLFDGGDKAAGPSEDLRVVSLLDRGVKDAQTLNAEPAVQADLDQTLGNIYQKLGKLDQADPLLHSALERRKALSGQDSSEVADSLAALALLRLDQAKVEEAERLAREGLAMSKRHLPPSDPAVARAAFALGKVLEERGAYGEATALLDESVRLQSARRETTAEFSDTLAALATAHYYLGHLPLADSLNRQALNVDRQLYGALHPRVGEELVDLGEIQHDLIHDAQAEQYYRQALAIFQSWYGAEHPNTAITMSAVGQSLVYQHRYDEAAPLLERALAIQERIFGKRHPQVAQGLNTLGLLELKRGRMREAEADFTRMADINRSVYGDRHYLVAVALMNLGQVHLEEKNYIQAERFYREALDRMKESLPSGHPSTAIAEIQLGHILVLERRYKEAESHLLAGYQAMIAQPSPQASRLQSARKDLVSVYEAMRQPDQAAKFRAELAAKDAPRITATP
jgi:eukaryotic-like serine/threonine-protein kinase